MARMFPEPLPEYIRENPLRGAEIRVYDALAKQLPAEFTVFYSSPWLGTAPDGREIDGEADFVVAHPELGLLVLEVKGGAISRDGATGQWRSRDAHGITHRIKNPVEQARQSKYQLLHKLKESGTWHPRFIRARHGVILPDCVEPAWDLGADMPRSIFAFEDDIGHLSDWVRHRLEGEEGNSEPPEQPLGFDGVSALERLLARSFILKTPLRNIFAQEDQRILLLTEEQYQILDGLEEHKRYAIAGAAGTGKTLLAVEKALRLSRTGQRTLLTCYNRPLAEHLRRACDGVNGPDVMSFHELCGRMANRAGVDLGTGMEMYTSSPHDAREFYSAILPEALMRSMERLPEERYDAIVVDEGQDFLPEWWIPLELCLRDIEKGVLYVFYDDNQRVRDAAMGFPDSLPRAPFRLTRNLRNTRPIFEASIPFYRGSAVRSCGPQGRPVEWVECAGGLTAADALIRRLGVLTKSDEVPLEEIAILTGNNATAARLQKGLAGRYETCSADQPRPAAIILDTARRFKGLERSVVILVHPGEMLNNPELLYVALTRARLHLIVVGLRPELEATRNYAAWGGPAGRQAFIGD